MDAHVIVEEPKGRGGAYVIVNLVKKKAYVGETNDLYRRMAEHIWGIYTDGGGTNENVYLEEAKNFDIWAEIIADYVKENRLQEWLADETVLMYLFRKNGFTLYNSEEDNTGKKRAFLHRAAVTKEEVVDCLNSICPQSDYGGYTTWDAYLEAVEAALKHDFFSKYGAPEAENADDFWERLSQSEPEAEWLKERRARRWCGAENAQGSAESDEYVVSVRNYKKICNQFMQRLLRKDDLESCGIVRMSRADIVGLIREGCFDKTVFSKFGAYLGQSAMTILTTKQFDIECNKLSDLEGFPSNGYSEASEAGVCFWSLKRAPVEHYRRVLNGAASDRRARYLILPFTASEAQYFQKDKTSSAIQKDTYQKVNITVTKESDAAKKREELWDSLDQENLEYGIAYGYSFEEDGEKRKRNVYPYPRTMFPEVIDKWEQNSAFLISGFWYLDADFSTAIRSDKNRALLKNFWSHPQGGRRELTDTLSGQNNSACAECKDRDELIGFFENDENFNPQSPFTPFLIARLEYPYIIRVVRDQDRRSP